MRHSSQNSSIPSRPARFITPHPKPPDQRTDKQKHDNPQRVKRQIPASRLPQQKLQGIVLDQAIGDHISTKPQDSFPINVNGVLAVRFCAVGEHIHQRSIFDGKEAEARLQHEQPDKQRSSAYDHGNDRPYRHQIPGNPAVPDSQRQRDDGGEQRAGSSYLKPACDHLKDQTARSEHQAVEASCPHHAGKCFEAVAEQLRKRKGHLNDGKAKQNVPVSVALDLREAREQEADRDQFAKSDQKARGNHQCKG